MYKKTINNRKKLSTSNNLSSLSDSDLINLYIDGSEPCLGILVNRHKNVIFLNILKCTRDRALAEDIFQDTFIRVIRSLKGGCYREHHKFLPWVLRIAKNITIDYYRKEKKVRLISHVKNRKGEMQSIYNVIDVGEKICINRIEKRQAHRRIRHLVKLLPIKQRQVLVMREYFDMSFSEISKNLNINLNTSLGRMRNALIQLSHMAAKEKKNLLDL